MENSFRKESLCIHETRESTDIFSIKLHNFGFLILVKSISTKILLIIKTIVNFQNFTNIPVSTWKNISAILPRIFDFLWSRSISTNLKDIPKTIFTTLYDAKIKILLTEKKILCVIFSFLVKTEKFTIIYISQKYTLLFVFYFHQIFFYENKIPSICEIKELLLFHSKKKIYVNCIEILCYDLITFFKVAFKRAFSGGRIFADSRKIFL